MTGGMGDPLLNCWILERNIQHYLTLDFHHFYESNMFYPHRLTLAYSEIFIATSAIATPFYLLSGGDIVITYNLLVILSLAMTAWGMHLLVRELTNRGPPAALAGIVFAFAPIRFGQIGHLHMLTTQWIPFIFLYLHRFAKTLSYRDALRFAGFFILNALTTAFYMVVMTFSLAIFAPILFWSRRRDWKRALLPAITAGILIFVVVVPVYEPYLEVRDQLGFKRDLRENRLYAARPGSWLGIPAENLIYGRLLHFERFSTPEGILFPGALAPLLALLLVAAAMLRRYQWSAEHGAYLAMTLAGLLVTFGPEFRSGHTNPFFMFYYNYFPGGNGHRVPARYAIIVLFGLAALAGYFTAWLMERKNRVFARLAVVLPALALLECISIPIYGEPMFNYKKIPPVYEWLAKQSPDTAILEIPANHSWLNLQDMFMSRFHGRLMVNGYSGYSPAVFNYLCAGSSVRLLGDDYLDVLRRIGVKYLVVHNSLIEEKERPAFAAACEVALRAGKLVAEKTFHDTTVYEVVGHAPAFGFPHALADLPDTITLRVPRNVALGKQKCTGALEFDGQTPWIITSGLVIPENRIVEATFLDAAGNDAGQQKCRLEPAARGIAGFTFDVPKQPGPYEIRLASRGRIIGKGLFSVENGLATSLKPDKLLAGIYPTPDRIATGSQDVMDFRVSVSNTGNTVWLACPNAGSGNPMGAIRLAYVLSKNGRRIQENRVRLPYDIGPGESAGLDLLIRAPVEPGYYRLKLDMVSEGIRWFEQDGSRPVFIDVAIGEKTDTLSSVVSNSDPLCDCKETDSRQSLQPEHFRQL